MRTKFEQYELRCRIERVCIFIGIIFILTGLYLAVGWPLTCVALGIFIIGLACNNFGM